MPRLARGVFSCLKNGGLLRHYGLRDRAAVFTP